MAYRKEKLEELIKRSVSDFLLTEIKDPRIGFVTVTKVELTKDYSIARVGISVLGNPREIRKSYEGLKSAAGFIQHHLGRKLTIRHVPRIEFQLDSSVMEGVNMVNLIDSVNAGNDKDDDEDQE
jgi:ribosome-binding factor A